MANQVNGTTIMSFNQTPVVQIVSDEASKTQTISAEGGTMPTPTNPGQSGTSVAWGQIFPTGEGSV